MELQLPCDIGGYLHIKYFLGTVQYFLNNHSIEMPVGITLVEQEKTVVVHITGVIARKTEDIAAPPFDPIQLNFQIDGATIVFDSHEIDDRLAVSPCKVFCIACE